MDRKIFLRTCIVAFLFGLLPNPSITLAQQRDPEGEDAVYYVGSGLLSLLYFPIKLATCVGTQAMTTVAYVSTYQVPGNFEGGTNGKEIGEVARGACGGSWLVSFNQVKKDYGDQVKKDYRKPVMAKEASGGGETTTQIATVGEAPVEKVVVKEVVKEVLKVVEVKTVILPDVAFRFDSAELTELGKGTVYLASQKIKEKSNVVIVVEGHADYIGSDDYNQQLGLRRAETVKRELGSLGVSSANMSVESFGKSKPLIDQRNDWARAVNRRVEINIKESK